jgi:hypothetical protein
MMNDFNPAEHLISIRNRQGSSEYLPVQWRLVWFRNECPEGSIETEIIHLDLEKETEEEVFAWNAEKRRNESVTKTARGIAIFRATVKDGRGGIATGTGSERAASFGDFIEKAETKAIGRALAGLGYGTQFAPELNEEHRIVDSPVESQQSNASNTPAPSASVPAPVASAPSATPAPVAIATDLRSLKMRAGKLRIAWSKLIVQMFGTMIADRDLADEHRDLIRLELDKREIGAVSLESA